MTATTTKKKSKKPDDVESLRRLVDQYQGIFDEVEHFVALIKRQDDEVHEKQTLVFEAKENYESLKADLAQAKDARDGTKHALFTYLKPGPTEILPLFDRMEEADEEKHGANSDEWRKEPISALGLSLAATEILTAADIVFVGQLQDRVQADAEQWWEKIEGMKAPTAAAILDLLNDFIAEHTKK